MALIALILAIAMPRLMPAILFGRLNGSARHLSGYGRALTAHCAMVREPVTFFVDLDRGEYWTKRWVLDFDDGLFEETEADRRDPEYWMNRAYESHSSQEEELAREAREMEEQFQRFARLSVQARANNLRRDGILSDIGPLFEDGIGLQWEDDEDDQLEELQVGLLERTALPEDVQFESVRVGGTEYRTGRAEVVATSLGLSESVEFILESKGEYYTVRWDAITGGSHIKRGLPEEEFEQ